MTLTRALTRAARVRGAATALVDGATRLTWSELQQRVARLAAVLAARGVRAGDRVGVLAHNSHRYVEAEFAILWLGAVVTPLNSRLALPELQALVRDAEPVLLLFDAAHAEKVQPLLDLLSAGALALGEAPVAGCEPTEPLLQAARPIAEVDARSDDVALIYYTGGTTGLPKGVMLTHANMEANSINVIAAAGFDERTVHLHCGPLFHVAAGARIFSVTRTAGTHVMLSRFDPETVLDTIERERVTVATFVPTMAREVALRLERSPRPLPGLSLVSYGGAPTPPDTLKRLMRVLPGVRFLQSYGQTECSPVATILDPRDHAERPEGDRLESVGRAALLSEVRVVDAKDDELPPGTVGEVLVRGPMVMRGYWRQPEATAQALRGGWLHTGDLGLFDEHGYLYVVDRLKDMIISGGENVYSIEVENALYKHPAVGQCAVFGVPHERWGEAVHAVVVCKPGENVDPDTLRAHCRTLLAGYKCPQAIEIRTEPLPLSGANKILKTELRAPFWRGRECTIG